MTLAERIKKARGNRLTQKELADAVGVSQPMISKLERGVTGETSLLIRIAKATGVRPEWLESEEGPMDATPASEPATDLAPEGDEAPIARISPEALALAESLLNGLSPTAREHVERIAELSRRGDLSDSDLEALRHLVERKTSRE